MIKFKKQTLNKANSFPYNSSTKRHCCKGVASLYAFSITSDASFSSVKKEMLLGE